MKKSKFTLPTKKEIEEHHRIMKERAEDPAYGARHALNNGIDPGFKEHDSPYWRARILKKEK